ncbi:hypothetical protein BDW02DRAFT_317965 [Decorospora gaudefroyi]|uniref:Rhodopsin domain-containing protein n=1 Tax=Decorospora gaudefroyi TaxID=184978 RepID=A0A6A5KHH8_9PLEO|nr:hypothetical protein BDW02DRAFT_317965 [Decorospora gaudefroyi]
MAAPVPDDIADLSPEQIAYTHGPVLLAQTVPVFTVAALVVFLRCYIRARVVKSFGKDDWTMVAAIVCATICCTCYSIQVSLGVGKYAAVAKANPEGYRNLLKARQIHMIAVVAGISLVKISVSFFLLRLATKKAYVWFLYGLIGFLALFTLACMGTLIFQCIPVAAAWDLRLRPPPMGTGDARCFSNLTFVQLGLFNGVVNIVTDLLLALIPAPLIWKLQMPIRTRMSLVVVLSLGVFAAVAGIIRQMSTNKLKGPEPWQYDTYTIWNFTELYVGIIAASLPAIKPMFNWFFDAARSITKGTKNSAFSSRNAKGYQKQVHPYDTDGFVLQNCKTEAEVRITSQNAQQSDWNLERANNSEDSILPHDKPDQKLGGIMVTSRVQVD